VKASYSVTSPSAIRHANVSGSFGLLPGGAQERTALLAQLPPGFQPFLRTMDCCVPERWRCLAVDRQQAKIVLKYTKAFFDRIGLLAGLVTRETADGLDLSTGAELTVATSNFRSVRGRTIACAILDEVAFWLSEDSASPDTETLAALVPGLATLPGSMIVGISSPHRRAGLLYENSRITTAKPTMTCSSSGRRLACSIRHLISGLSTRPWREIPPRLAPNGWPNGAMTLRLSCPAI
jgi:hypothetical protein